MVVSVQFRNCPFKTYDYLTSLPLHKGDFVVVPTRALGKGDPTAADIDHIAVAQVICLKAESDKATAWVISKVPLREFLDLMVKRKMEE